MFRIRLLHQYLLRSVIPPFLISLFLFTFFVETLDILVNLIRYLDKEISTYNIFLLQWLYLPTSFSYALPVSILFSVTYSIGLLYANNELIAVFTSGISLIRFIFPLIIFGAMLGLGNYYFREQVVIQTIREKNELTRLLFNQNISLSSSQVAILQDGGEIVYYADFYDDIQKSINNAIIVVTDQNNKLEMTIKAQKAVWDGTKWKFQKLSIYRYDEKTELYIVETLQNYENIKINAHPENFQRIISNVDEMLYSDAMKYIKQLKEKGHAYQKLLTDTYARIPLALSPFIVMIVACISGSVFRKNIMLMSLLNALVTAVVYYSTDLIGSIMAARGLVPPFIGAWVGFFVTIMISMFIYRFFIK